MGLINEDDLKRPLVPLKLAKASPKLHLETTPGWVGPGRFGPIMIIRLLSPAVLGLGLSLAISINRLFLFL